MFPGEKWQSCDVRPQLWRQQSAVLHPHHTMAKVIGIAIKTKKWWWSETGRTLCTQALHTAQVKKAFELAKSLSKVTNRYLECRAMIRERKEETDPLHKGHWDKTVTVCRTKTIIWVESPLSEIPGISGLGNMLKYVTLSYAWWNVWGTQPESNHSIRLCTAYISLCCLKVFSYNIFNAPAVWMWPVTWNVGNFRLLFHVSV